MKQNLEGSFLVNNELISFCMDSNPMITSKTINGGGCISTKDFFGELAYTAYPRNMLKMLIDNRIISIINY